MGGITHTRMQLTERAEAPAQHQQQQSSSSQSMKDGQTEQLQQYEQLNQAQEQQQYFAFLKEPSPGTFFKQKKPPLHAQDKDQAVPPGPAEILELSPTVGKAFFRLPSPEAKSEQL
jgi:hypothetical protein